MDGAMGKEEEVVEAVLTCEGDFHDPELLDHLEKFRLKLTDLLLADEAKLNLKKVEPWNSVKVTFTIPRESALRLRQLAQSGNEVLRQLGVLSVQIQGDSSISLKIVGRNNETTELMLHTSRTPSLPSEHGTTVSTANEISSPGPSNEEVTRRNIVDYLIQGPPSLRPNAIFNSILGGNAAPATSSFPAAHRGLPTAPDPLSGVRSNRPILHPNSMASVVAQPSPVRGSHPNLFPFAKTSGAFHVPIPHQSTAGQSASDFPNSLSVNNNAHSSSLGFQNSVPQQKKPGNNMFGPIGGKIPGSANINNINDTLSPSSSPGFIMDLPPPPPYPHNTSSSTSNKMGKQVSATSPLLVNLLQTDPIAVAAGVASMNTNKSVTVGTTSPAPPAKKKKRAKKPKEAVSNSLSNADDILHKDVMDTNPMFSAESTRVPDPSASFSSKLQEYFPGRSQTAQSFSTLRRTEVEFKTASDKSFKPLISGRPFNENSVNSSAFPFSKFNANSAIGTDHVRSGETNGPRELSQELMDSFSKEIAAGKIINPYTGQLEPRDHLPDGTGGKFKDDVISSRVFPHKAREIGNSNFSDIPASVSQMMDMNVRRNLSSVSSSTAALFHSGSTLLLNNEKQTPQFSSHRTHLTDSSVSTSKNFYAAKLSSKLDNDNLISSISSTVSQSTLNSHQISTGSVQNQVKRSNPSPVPSPGSSLTNAPGRPATGQHVLTPHTVPLSLLSSGVSESVINSKSGSLCSSTLPITHKDSFVKHSEHNPSLFQLTSCANSNTQSSVPHHPLSSTMFSSSSLSVVQTRPVPSQAQSSVQGSGRLIPSDVPKSIPSQHVQAASSDLISVSSKTNFPHLLNSHPEKSLDQHGMIQSPLEKVSPEGDDNSNHSGLVSENLPENSGTSVLLEHTGVKVENHDSGVGSSSERSDDTPSEPGDGEFRANNSCSESEEANKTAKKLVNYKADVGNDSSSMNTITVGYMMSSMDNSSHLKPSQTKDKHEDAKATSLSVATSSSFPKLDTSFDTQGSSLHKRSDLSSSHPLSSPDWMIRNTQVQSSTYAGKGKLNGPLNEKEDGLKLAKKEFQNDLKLNGPNSKEVDEMLLTIQSLQEKGEQLPSRTSPAFKRHGLQLQQEVLEEMAKLQQLAASKELSHVHGKLDKDDLSDPMHRAMGNHEDRPDQLPFFDIDDLVNGKLFGNGTPNVDSKTGSNITSIYSKRSSPVNVNMLNHIYAPGLPLPRRLTESVQRLVKPLPATESSMPQMRLCKSPGVGSSPRTGTSPNGPSPSRMTLQSGTRSPGSSIPKLMPYDKHSLLSGGLDLAGLSSKFPPNSLPLADLAPENMSGDSAPRMLGLTTDFLSRDGQGHGFLSSCHISPPLLTESLIHTQKMLSQSYPPHKSRDLSNVSIHDLFSRIQQPPRSSTDSWQDSGTHLLKSSSEPTISSHQSQRHQHNIPHSVSYSSSSPLSTFSYSSCSHVTLSSETSTTNTESTLSKSSKTMYSGSSITSSSPNHSRSTSPATLSNSKRLESSPLSSTNSLAFKTAPDTGGMLPHWAKISLNNGSKNSLNQKSAVSSQKNVPYVTLSSSSVAGSAVHSAQSVPSRITPAVCSARLSGSVVGNASNSSIDNRAVMKSSKPDSCSSSPRAITKSDFASTRSSPLASTIGRNLFESVSCDLPTIPYSVVQTSRNKTLDTLVSHSSSKSVLDLNHAGDLHLQSSKGQRKKSDSSQGHISPPPSLNFHSDINSLQSIRTNETPSTSLPAQVVHLDFPHLPPTVSEPAISNSVVDHVLPMSQKLVKSPATASNNVSHNWNSAPANFTTPVTSFPVKTSSVSKTNPHYSSVTLDKKDHQIKTLQANSSPPLVKEPILETLASALGSSFNKTNEKENPEVKSSNSTSISIPVANFKNEEKQSVGDSSVAVVSKKTLDDEMPDLSSEQISTPKRISRKRGSHFMDMEGEGDQNSDSCSAAKRSLMESTSEPPSDSCTNVVSDEVVSTEVKDKFDEKAVVPAPVETKEQGKGSGSVVPGSGEANDECGDYTKEQVTKLSVHSLFTDLQKTIDNPRSTISPETTEAEDKSIPILSAVEYVKPECVNVEKAGERPAETKFSDPERKGFDNIRSDMVFDSSTQNKLNFSQELPDNSQDTYSEEKQIVGMDFDTNVIDNKSDQFLEETEGQKEKTDVENICDPDSLAPTLNAEPKLEDGSKKGHRVKRQFYAYVPEKSIDQTYFDTPILSGRTRSRNKPSEPENTMSQEEQNAAPSSSDSQLSAINASVKTEASDAGNKRSTRSLRTKDNSQDFTANKRRRLQTRDHR